MFRNALMVSSMVVVLLASSAFARDLVPTRAQDATTKYVLDGDDALWQLMSGQWCLIANDVADVKLTPGFKDKPTLMVLLKDGRLYSKKPGWCAAPGNLHLVASNAVRLSILEKKESALYVLALKDDGVLVGWDRSGESTLQITGVRDYRVNPNYLVEGAAFSSYILFLQDFAGRVYKVKGGGYAIVAEDSYSSLSDFMGKVSPNRPNKPAIPEFVCGCTVEEGAWSKSFNVRVAASTASSATAQARNACLARAQEINPFVSSVIASVYVRGCSR